GHETRQRSSWGCCRSYSFRTSPCACRWWRSWCVSSINCARGSAPPERRHEHDEEGEQFEPARDHCQGKQPSLEIAECSIAGVRAELTEGRPEIVDRGHDHRKGGQEIHARCHH